MQSNTFMGSLNGTGYYSKLVTLTGPDGSGLELCAQAQKLDGTNNTLILTVTGYNETSQPYGSTSYCGGGGTMSSPFGSDKTISHERRQRFLPRFSFT